MKLLLIISMLRNLFIRPCVISLDMTRFEFAFRSTLWIQSDIRSIK